MAQIAQMAKRLLCEWSATHEQSGTPGLDASKGLLICAICG